MGDSNTPSVPYYQDDWVTIYHGDSREFLWLGFDSLVTDPPYYGREDLFDTVAVEHVLTTTLAVAPEALIFWPVLAEYPKTPNAVHIWHKSVPIHPASTTGNVAGHHYERILSYGLGSRSEVFRVAAIMPNFATCADELTPHPTQKPLALMRELVARTKGATVFDPFMGSGSTLRAAKDLNRRAIGIDKDERWCEIAANRMAQEVLELVS